MHHNHVTDFSRKVQSSTDVEFLQRIANFGNRYQRNLAKVRLGILIPPMQTTKMMAKSIVNVVTSVTQPSAITQPSKEELLKQKRSEAAKKAAATRRAKKLAQVA